MIAEIFGPDLLIVIIVVAVLIFGGSAIPRLARNLGSAKTEFEKGLKAGKGQGDAAKSGDAAAASDAPKPESDQ
jgi:sec-independent protein translocase protein TatA